MLVPFYHSSSYSTTVYIHPRYTWNIFDLRILYGHVIMQIFQDCIGIYRTYVIQYGLNLYNHISTSCKHYGRSFSRRCLRMVAPAGVQGRSLYRPRFRNRRSGAEPGKGPIESRDRGRAAVTGTNACQSSKRYGQVRSLHADILRWHRIAPFLLLGVGTSCLAGGLAWIGVPLGQ